MVKSDYYSGKNILITGGAGAIGKNLVEALLDSANKVIILDDLSSGHLINVPKSNKIVFLKESVIDEASLDRAFKDNIDIVFHLAANFANQNSVDNPEKDLLVNGLGTLKMLEWSRKHNIKKFILTSSSCVYGNLSDQLSENLLPSKMDTPYAMTKLLGERYVNFFHNHYQLPTVILRYFNSYGPGEVPGKYRNVIPNFIWLALNDQSLKITGTGTETRDFTYVSDIVDGTLLAGQNEKAVGEVFNLGKGAETKVLDLANRINRVSGNKAELIFTQPRDWDSIKRRRASIEKARQILGYSPKTELDTGLKNTYEWILEKKDYISKNIK